MGSKMRGGSIQRIVQGPDTKQEPDNIMRRVVGSAAALPGAGQHVRKGDADAAIHPSSHSTFSCEMDHFGISLLGCSFANPRRAESCGTTKVVNDFQRWSADFLLYLPAFIEKKNSPFLHTQHPRAALSTGNSSSSIALKTRDARTQRLNSSSRDIGNKL